MFITMKILLMLASLIVMIFWIPFLVYWLGKGLDCIFKYSISNHLDLQD